MVDIVNYILAFVNYIKKTTLLFIAIQNELRLLPDIYEQAEPGIELAGL
jgi:hypothetical protein